MVGEAEQDAKREKPARGRPPLKVDFTSIERFLHLPQPEAAKALGISLTSLKLVCRKKGLTKWPYRRAGRNGGAPRADLGVGAQAGCMGQGAAAGAAPNGQAPASAPWYA